MTTPQDKLARAHWRPCVTLFADGTLAIDWSESFDGYQAERYADLDTEDDHGFADLFDETVVQVPPRLPGVEVLPVDGLTAREYRLPPGTGFRAYRKLDGRTVAYSLPCETEAEAVRALAEDPIRPHFG